jgi:photosystem II stability/assembly factor-like uncharacterized protein
MTMYARTLFNKMTCRLSAVALALFLASPAPAELKPQPAAATTAATKAMMLAAVNVGKRIVAVGDYGIVLLSDDDGAHFRQAKSVPVRSTLTAVAFVDEKTGWAVGQWGVILATADGGETWQLQRSDTSVDRPLFSVYFKDRDHGWAVGLWSLMLTTKDGGKTWNAGKLPAPPGGGKSDRNLLRIFANRKGTLFVAAEQGTVLRSSDGGATWTYANTGYKGSFWTGISLKDGTLLVGGLRGTIYRSTDDGQSWKETKSGVQSSITDFAEAGGRVFAVGLDGVCLVSGNGGASFTLSQREDRLPFTALTVADNGRLLAFSKQGMVKDFPEEKKK